MIADRKGTIYIAQNKGVFAYEGESGKLLYKDEKISPKGLTLLPDGKLAVTNDRGFSIFDAELNKLTEFKDANEAGNSTFGFEQIAADGDGIMYMITKTDNYVCKFTSDGKFLDRFKIEGAPNSIAIDNKGRIFISDTSEINVYDAEGKLLESFGTTQAFGMAFNDAGELFVASRPFVTKYQLNF
jgi:sugar lactone lactonase YvrE